MPHKLIFCFVLVFFYCVAGLQRAVAQSSDAPYFVPSLYPKSPNVSSYTKYGDYQVNLFTGIPDISIPLYTIEAGGLKMPITLSYHASGIKLADVASWVGLGWSVAGGGAVTRRVVGGPDDGPYGYLRTYVHQQSALNMEVDSDMLYVDNIANGTYDGRPDIYSFDFPGHSGKFFFNGMNGFQPVLVPAQPVNINYNMAMERFILTDENGDLFKFGEASSEYTESSGGGNNAGPPSITSWMMENMISQNRRDTISFSYGSDDLTYPAATAQMLAVTDQIDNIFGPTPYPYNPNISPGTTTGFLTSVTELPMKEIDYKNGKVVFDLDTAQRLDLTTQVYGLSDIKIYSYNYGTKLMEVQKTVKFYKSYFGSAGANNRRLKLDSIQVLDKAGAIIQHYRFGYNYSISMPPYSSLAYDYWGYYNGKDANTSLIPQQTVSYNGGTTQIGGSIANNREPDSLHMQACMLDTVFYPTGGYSTFTYQTNQYYNSSGTLRIAGGLRVTAIKSYDSFSATPILKTYVYNIADSNFFLNYHYFAAPTQTHRYYITEGSAGLHEVGSTCMVRNFVSNPIIDLEPWDAAAVVYPLVTEYYGTPGANVGGSTYLFRFETDATQTASEAGKPIVTSYYYNRGQLLKQTDFLLTPSGTAQTVKLVTNTYGAFPEQRYFNVGFVANKIFSNEGPGFGNTYPILYSERAYVVPTDVGSYNYANYYIYSTDNHLTSTVTQNYDINNPSNYTTSTVNYTYDDTSHLQVTQITHTDSKGNTHIDVSKHAYDYLSGLTTHNNVLDTMINRHIFNETIEKWDTLKNAATGVNAVTGAQLNKYKYGSKSGTIVPAYISTLSVGVPLTNFTPASVVSGSLTNDSRYVQMISFDQYDSQNNITQYKPRNATPTAVLWDYNYELPVAQIKNAPVINASYLYFAYTGFEATSGGGWSYSGKPQFDPTAPTGAYSYPLSAGNITSTALDNSMGYVVSYWAKSGPATVIYGGTGISANSLNTVNGWTYYEHVLPVRSTAVSITISGTSVTLDELRLYPALSQMTTYSYNPSGPSSIADTKGMNSYFDYDYFQRLKDTKDWAGNIVKNYSYNTYDQTYGNYNQTATYTRNNCPANNTPGALTYTVPPNKYHGSTQASANADAIYDRNLNGQIKANQNCSCTPYDFVLYNGTGLNGFQATFSGIGTPFSFPTSGSLNIQVPPGRYSSVSINGVGGNRYTFTLTGFAPVTNQYTATFTGVTVSASAPLTLTVQNP